MISDQTIKEVVQFTKDRDWDQFHSPGNLAKSISIEANELLECFQWNDTNYDKTHAVEELADVLNYCILMADKLGVDLDQIVQDKLAINARKYPPEKAKGTSKKYSDL